TYITEIIPQNIFDDPDLAWVKEAFDNGQFFNVVLERIKQVELNFANMLKQRDKALNDLVNYEGLEIVPDDMFSDPDLVWAKEAFDNGQFLTVALERLEIAESNFVDMLKQRDKALDELDVLRKAFRKS
ncbi:MAG: hypothetical protein JKY33_10680, partial [Bacteroidia bacterium]|nr:hypothetical protein [Bacteroidia bacterium]